MTVRFSRGGLEDLGELLGLDLVEGDGPPGPPRRPHEEKDPPQSPGPMNAAADAEPEPAGPALVDLRRPQRAHELRAIGPEDGPGEPGRADDQAQDRDRGLEGVHRADSIIPPP